MTQGERVKEIRKALGLTLEKFGELLALEKLPFLILKKEIAISPSR